MVVRTVLVLFRLTLAAGASGGNESVTTTAAAELPAADGRELGLRTLEGIGLGTTTE